MTISPGRSDIGTELDERGNIAVLCRLYTLQYMRLEKYLIFLEPHCSLGPLSTTEFVDPAL
ncbi:hypothetical protein A8F26_04730 [Burkholderia cenocepacia]|nr:hypothetical protein A3203_02185 [Burkholderia cenocepacia]AOK37282.1 hypothetical protein WL90_23430 [Burkholderia cenocepacia]AQQ22495.1 hypothetical protein A8D61_30865 [Burkholderia cenocepacia]ARF87267.1 uncharacterized protein BCN122_II0524 [Burkholderia cenocepacia]KKI80451.1 hypothetical protein WQ49_19105 [Burkholderia cenocepacia]